MVNEAKQNAAADKARRELIEAKNNADQLAYQTEKTLNDLGDKVSEVEKKNIENKIKEVREASQTDDAARIKTLTDDLQNAFHALSQQMYAQEGGQPGGPPPGAGPVPGTNGSSGETPEEEGDVIEGEFREA
jgi:molecular chaperone DnaK